MGHTWMKGRSGLSEKLKVWSRHVAARPARGRGAWEESPPPVLPWPSHLGTLVAVRAPCTLSTHPLCSSRPRAAVLPPTLRGSYGWSPGPPQVVVRLLKHCVTPWNGKPSPWKPHSGALICHWCQTEGTMGSLRCSSRDEGLKTQEPTAHPCSPRGCGHPCSGLHIHLGTHMPPCRSLWHGGPALQPGAVTTSGTAARDRQRVLPNLWSLIFSWCTWQLKTCCCLELRVKPKSLFIKSWHDSQVCSPTQAVFSLSPITVDD